MTPLQRLLLPAWARAFFLTNVGGLLVLALVVATESADDSFAVLGDRICRDVPHTWALLSPALALAAAALATGRMRGSGELLAMATLGLSRLRVLLSVAWVALPTAALAAVVGRGTEPAVTVARAAGAWIVEGRVLLDPGAATPSAAALAAVRYGDPLDWPGTAILLVAAALSGAALGARGGGRAVLMAAAAVVVADLVRRGVDPAVGLGILAATAGVAGGLVWRGAGR